MAFYSGKHEQNKKSGFWRRPALVVLSLAMLLLVSVGGTLAFLIDKTDSVQNTFTPSTMTINIEEDFEDGGTVKENVRIENTGEVDAWIRATVIFNWADANGNPVKQVDVGDLDISLNDSDWFKSGDYYYHHAEVKVGGSTQPLIYSVQLRSNVTPPAGADHLQVTIVSQAIQSSPEAALTATGWPVQISDGQLTK